MAKMFDREDRLLRQALTDLAQQEIRAAAQDETLDAEYLRTLPAVRRHIVRRAAPAPRLRMKALAIAAAVLVVFYGACLASEEVRTQLFRFVEQQWGRYHELDMRYVGDDATEYKPTVAADDPRLDYVWQDWALHYYPLYLPGGYQTGERMQHVPDEAIAANGGSSMNLNDEAKAILLAEDTCALFLYSEDENERSQIVFSECGRQDVRFTYENQTNEVVQKNIGGWDVTIVHAGSSYRCYWNQDDHVFALTTTGLPLEEVEKIVENVERIR